MPAIVEIPELNEFANHIKTTKGLHRRYEMQAFEFS